MSETDTTVPQRYDPNSKKEILQEEKDYQNKEYPDEQTFLKKKTLECTSCGKELRKAIVISQKLCIHPALEVIICDKCESFYGSGEFSVDEDGSDKYCRWCGQGGRLFCCSFCSIAICAKCVKRNLPKKYIKEIERDEWKCFVCDPKPIWNHRALCAAAKRYIQSKQLFARPKRARKIQNSSESEDMEFSVSQVKKSKLENSETKNNIRENSKRRRRSSTDETEDVQKVSRKSRQSTDPDSRIKHEKSPLELALLDTTKDIDRFIKVLTSSKNEFVEKFLKNKKYCNDPDKLPIVRDELLKLIRNSKESIKLLEHSFLNILKNVEDHEKTSTDDQTPNVEKDNENLVDNEATSNHEKPVDNDASSNNEETVDNDATSNDEKIVDNDKTPNHEKPLPSNTTPNLEKNNGKTLNRGKSSNKKNNQNSTVGSDDSTMLESETNEEDESDKIENSKTVENEKITKQCSLNDSTVSNTEKSSTNDESEKDDIFEDAMTDDTGEMSFLNGDSLKKHKIDFHSESQNTQQDIEMNEENESEPTEINDSEKIDENLSQVLEPHNSSNSSKLSENEENLIPEDESDISGIEVLNPDAEEVKLKKERVRNKENKMKNGISSDLKLHKDENEETTKLPDEGKQTISVPQEKGINSVDEKAKESFFHDSSDDEEENEIHELINLRSSKIKQMENEAKESFFQNSDSDEDNESLTLKVPKKKKLIKVLVNFTSDDEEEEELQVQNKSGLTCSGSGGKKKKTKESCLSRNSGSDEDEEINKLINLRSLNKKKRNTIGSSDDEREETELKSANEEELENVIPEVNNKRKVSLKKQDKSLAEYLSSDNNSDKDSHADEDTFLKFKHDMSQKMESKDDIAKRLMLHSESSSNDDDDDDHKNYSFDFNKNDKPNKKLEKRKKVHVETIQSSNDEKNSNSDSDTTQGKKKKSKRKSDPLLRGKLSATDTSDEERMIERSRQKANRSSKSLHENESSDSDDIFMPKSKFPALKKRRYVLQSSGSEVEEVRSTESSESPDESTQKKKKVTKRRRIKNPVLSDESENENLDQSQSSAKGRKNIRHIMKGAELDEQTRKTAKEEEARKKRIAERQALFNKVFEVPSTSEESISQLVLDYDTETKTELVSVDPKLLKKLKPHQVQGVRFMWEACFESLNEIKRRKGGGCILAHCMGLGKTLQVITLVHTLLRHEATQTKTVLIICPLTTVLNWFAEFEKWLQDLDDYDEMDVYELTKLRNNITRADRLNHWAKNGGVMILGYEMFRSLINTKTIKEKYKKQITNALLDPGPDLVICDEGHILKNEKSAISKATMDIKSLRRIVLTGTPLQNNLIEYHCMVQFVKPNLLGNKKEFQNRFVHPITNGQYVDSTAKDVKLMKRRAHVLHKMLDGIVQRFDYNVLKPFLPPKHEFVISVGLSDLQATLYEYYIKNKSQVSNECGGKMRLFKDYQIMRLIWTHPLAMKLNADKKQKIQEKEESENSLDDFVVSDSDSNSSSKSSVISISSTASKKKDKYLTRAQRKELGTDLNEMQESPPEVTNYWWQEFVSSEDLEDYKKGPKLMLLFAILRQCELIGDKVLIFSQSIPSLDMIEYFLGRNDEFSQRLPQDSSFLTEPAEDYIGIWEKNRDYFRLDGQTPNEQRASYCKIFNRPENTRARLFLISTKAGGLGINLTAANRVIIFDASWNPSYDIQSIFRVYRFGQNKPCYVYRFLSQGTMEEKIYERQVTKLSVSCRVVDEQQIDRHFSRKDITELYTFNRKTPSLDEIPKLPSDRLMAELLKEYKDVIISYHEHDSLLENIEEEELTEEERKLAWKDYEDEKNRPLMATQSKMTHISLYEEVSKNFNDQIILSALTKEHPRATQPQLMTMLNIVRQKLFQYYLTEAKLNHGTLTSNTLGNNVKNPATEKQMQEQMQMKQAALLHALQAQAMPNLNMDVDLDMPSTSNAAEGLECHGYTTPTKYNRDHEDSSSSYSTPVKNVSPYASPLKTPTKNRPDFISPLSSPIKNPLKEPCTWALRWNSPGKDPSELKTLAAMQCNYWRPAPTFSIVGNNVLIHLGFLIRRFKLENKLSRYGVNMSIVNPDFETAESLLGYPPRSFVQQFISETYPIYDAKHVNVSDSDSENQSELFDLFNDTDLSNKFELDDYGTT